MAETTPDQERRPRPDVVAHLQGSSVFGDLDRSVLERLASCLTETTLRAGDALMVEGDDAGDAYILVAGRLVVTTTDGEGERTIAQLAPGSVVGEMSLLSGAPRSATVRALRDSQLLRLSDGDFRRIVLDDAQALLDVTRTVVRRLDQSIHRRAPTIGVSVIGVIPTGKDPDVARFASAFAERVGVGSAVAIVDRARLASLGHEPTAAEVSEFVNRVEDAHELTLLVADAADTPWTRRCIRQADINFLVAGAAGAAERSGAEGALREWSTGVDHPIPVHLVLVQDDGARRGTPAVLSGRELKQHHHVRLSAAADLERLGRVVRRSTVALVLSGGGARGFAHLGVIKAMLEAGVPIDHIGGASIGASVAASFAMGWDWDTMLEWERYATVDRGSLIDFSFPAVALARGEKLTSAMRQAYGDAHIEDMWADYFSVSTDLTAGRLRIHDRGLVWQAIRASVAIPGIFPPVRAGDGHVLVDGGVLNNLPTDVMRDRYQPATVIAVDLQGSLDLPSSDLNGDGIVSGWRVAGRRLAPWKQAMAVPRMVDVLSRATALTGSQSAEYADLVLRPPVDGVGVLDFSDYERVVDVGYRHAVEVLENWDGVSGPGATT